MKKPLDTIVSIVQTNHSRRWRVMLQYEDGESYLSRETYATEDEAEAAAAKWVNENAIHDGPLH
jgi:hypothetical protein